jgi:hypothetical protein
MLYIRQGATHKVVLGPAVAVGDGFTPVTNLTVSGADEAEAILHDNGTVVDISGYTFAAITTADGYYHLTLQSGISGTVGHMTVVINDDSLILPLRADFTVLEETVYDAMFAASAAGEFAVALSTQGKADVNAEADTALSDYDPPTNAEMEARTIAAGDYPTHTELISEINDVQTDIAALNNLSAAAVNAEVDTALADYDAPTKAELDSGLAGLNDPTAAAIADAVWDEAKADHTTSTTFGDLATDLDAVLVDTGTTLQGELDGIQADTEDIQARIPAALVSGRIDATVDATGMESGATDAIRDAIVDKQIDDSVPADGTIPTIEQALYMITQFLFERSVSGTTVTVKKADGSTALLTLSLDDGDTPTSISRAT